MTLKKLRRSLYQRKHLNIYLYGNNFNINYKNHESLEEKPFWEYIHLYYIIL